LILASVEKCEDVHRKAILREQTWAPIVQNYKVLSPAEASQFQIQSAMNSICFDPALGVSGVFKRKVIVIAPVKDLTQSRVDRASFVVIEGESAKISIN
jgi:hypothetical protein